MGGRGGGGLAAAWAIFSFWPSMLDKSYVLLERYKVSRVVFNVKLQGKTVYACSREIGADILAGREDAREAMVYDMEARKRKQKRRGEKGC